jgi:hypothetical protein
MVQKAQRMLLRRPLFLLGDDMLERRFQLLTVSIEHRETLLKLLQCFAYTDHCRRCASAVIGFRKNLIKSSYCRGVKLLSMRHLRLV